MKKALIITGISIALLVSYIVAVLAGSVWGSWSETVLVEGKTVYKSKLEKSLAASQDKYKTVQTDIKNIQTQLDTKKDELANAAAIINSKEKNENELNLLNEKLKDTKAALNKELEDGRAKIKEDLRAAQEKNSNLIASANKELEHLKKKISAAKTELDSKEKQLASLAGQLQKAKGSPKILNAGIYTVGRDLPASRYKATPVGEGSNFIVNEGLKVNTILGSYGEESYTFFADEGDIIQTEAKVKLTPVSE